MKKLFFVLTSLLYVSLVVILFLLLAAFLDSYFSSRNQTHQQSATVVRSTKLAGNTLIQVKINLPKSQINA